MSKIFHRTELATRMAQQLIHPGALDEGLRSGLFISGLRRTGKTTYLLNDLIPALEHTGAIVIYVDLWSNTEANPAVLIRNAIRNTMDELQTIGSGILKKLATVSGSDVGAFGFKFGFKLDRVGKPGGATLAQALLDLVDQAKTDVVLIVDEVQHAITTEDGNRLLLALKAARDAINPRPGTPGHFLFIGTGSHRALIAELIARRNQAFDGATSIDFPVLAADYIGHLFQRLDADGVAVLPSSAVAVEAFSMLANRPEEMIKALRQLQHIPPGSNPDQFLPVIAATLRSAAADIELAKVEQLGGLATAIFERIAATDGDTKGVFSSDAAADYSRSVGREVRVEEVQPVVNELMAANIIMRRAHGRYGVTDPHVQELSREKKSLES
jgi:hypothetical protein